MIDRIRKAILLSTNTHGELAESLADTVANIVISEIVGDLRAELLVDGGCEKCLEIRRRAIDLVLEKAPDK